MERIARAMVALFEAPPPGAAVGFAVLDCDLRYIAVSPSLAPVHGGSTEASVGRPLRDVLPMLADEIEPVLRDVLATGEPRLGMEVGGGGRTWLCSYYPLCDAGDAAVGAITVEITDRKRAELALRESGERLVEAQRLARMGAWTWHADGSRTEWSEALFGVYGFPPPEPPPNEEWLRRVVDDDRG